MIKSKKKRIAILTGGGDCPGLNVVIKTVAQYAMNHYGWEVIGVKNALNGIVSDIKFSDTDVNIHIFPVS